jgi:hypothetical protein
MSDPGSVETIFIILSLTLLFLSVLLAPIIQNIPLSLSISITAPPQEASYVLIAFGNGSAVLYDINGSEMLSGSEDTVFGNISIIPEGSRLKISGVFTNQSLTIFLVRTLYITNDAIGNITIMTNTSIYVKSYTKGINIMIYNASGDVRGEIKMLRAENSQLFINTSLYTLYLNSTAVNGYAEVDKGSLSIINSSGNLSVKGSVGEAHIINSSIAYLNILVSEGLLEIYNSTYSNISIISVESGRASLTYPSPAYYNLDLVMRRDVLNTTSVTFQVLKPTNNYDIWYVSTSLVNISFTNLSQTTVYDDGTFINIRIDFTTAVSGTVFTRIFIKFSP